MERLHRTDDEEFYKPLLLASRNTEEYLDNAFQWQVFYDLYRPRYGVGMNGLTPMEKLRELGGMYLTNSCFFLQSSSTVSPPRSSSRLDTRSRQNTAPPNHKAAGLPRAEPGYNRHNGGCGLTRKIILASGSERRRALLARMGYSFDVIVPAVNEDLLLNRRPPLPPPVYAERAAEVKAEAVIGRAGDALIIAADTVVAHDGTIIGKPRDRADALRILRRLCGSTHSVITGFCVLDTVRRLRIISSDETLLCMVPMTEAEITAYVDSGESAGKAGAYAIQESGDRYVSVLRGSLTNVVGLPAERLTEVLGLLGVRGS